MHRELDSDARETAPDRGVVRESPAWRDARERLEKPPGGRERQPVQHRGRTYQISDVQRQTMRAIGRFRTVAAEDLARVGYRNDPAALQRDLRSLVAQGLVQRRTAWIGGSQKKLTVLVLSRAGKDALERESPEGSQQVFYSGFVKPAEVAHDAALYRMYQAEAARIESHGGQVRRVVLDYEFKKRIYSPLARARQLPPLAYAKRQLEVAQENALKVVHGKIPLPDLRIEYETAEGELARVDLELATHHYHGAQLSEKALAGFRMYAPGDSVSRLSAVLDDHDITADLLSL